MAAMFWLPDGAPGSVTSWKLLARIGGKALVRHAAEAAVSSLGRSGYRGDRLLLRGGRRRTLHGAPCFRSSIMPCLHKGFRHPLKAGFSSFLQRRGLRLFSSGTCPS